MRSAPCRPSKLLAILRPPEIRIHQLRRLWHCIAGFPGLPSSRGTQCFAVIPPSNGFKRLRAGEM